MKQFPLIVMLVLIFSALSFSGSSQTGGGNETICQTIDLRLDPGFNPWIIWWKSDSYRINYTWLEFRREFAELNNLPNTDYAMRHVGLGSMKNQKGIIRLPTLKPIPLSAKEARQIELDKLQVSLLAKERQLMDKEKELATRNETIQKQLGEISTREKKLSQLGQLLSTKETALDARQPTLTNHLARAQNTETRQDTKASSGEKASLVMIIFSLVIIIFFAVFLSFTRWKDGDRKTIKSIGKKNDELLKQNAQLQDDNLRFSIVCEEGIIKLRSELEETQAYIDEMEEIFKQHLQTFEIEEDLARQLSNGRQVRPQNIFLAKVPGSDLVRPPCLQVEMKFKNVRNHIPHCPACQKALEKLGVIPADENHVSAEVPNGHETSPARPLK